MRHSKHICNLKDFARATVLTRDLDPTYDLLYNLSKERGPEYINRVCLYMLMFYDLRAALEVSKFKGGRFWTFIGDNYATLDRGTERRHFRGTICLDTLHALREAYPTKPERFMEDTYDKSLLMLERKMRQFPNFGPYFIWKAADYQDRILSRPVDYTDNLKILPDQPRKSATIFFPNESFESALDAVAYEIRDLPAPGEPNRQCSISEAETVLCMGKTFFITKQAFIGKDLMLRWKELGETKYARFLPPPINVADYTRGEYA